MEANYSLKAPNHQCYLAYLRGLFAGSAISIRTLFHRYLFCRYSMNHIVI